MFAPSSIDEYNRHEERMEALERYQRQHQAGRWQRQQFDLFDVDEYLDSRESFECPNCGGHGSPVSFDFGTCSETGYSDAGEGCTECLEVR